MHSSAALVEDRAPQKNCPRERDQAEESPQKIIPAVDERILQPEIKDGDVLSDCDWFNLLNASPAYAWFGTEGAARFCANSTASLIAAIMLSGRAIPFPAMSKAVP